MFTRRGALLYGTFIAVLTWHAEAFSQETHRLFQMTLRNPVRAIGRKLQRAALREICYDTVGCFEIQKRHMALTRLPESPEYLDTEFYLFTRETDINAPDRLNYGDNQQSLKKSAFKPEKKVAILIHGYMTTWNETGAVKAIKAFSVIDDINLVLVNWERGARGPRYTTAAANTELVGRQLGLLLLDMIAYGVDPSNIHIIGFSLGAHVAGVASEMLKEKNYLIGRITGLDPASPLFKLDHFKDKKKKLDISDAEFVDVIHTDASATFTDGFGLMVPLGHVDFYPNGGQEQPGCNDIKASVVVSQFEGALDRNVACSHIRSFAYYLETLLGLASKKQGCEFLAWNCFKGSEDFYQGKCFPMNESLKIFGRMGENPMGQGPMYLVTRPEFPFCGTPVQAIVHVSLNTKPTRGVLNINLYHANTTTNIFVNAEINERVHKGKIFYGLAAADYGSLDNYKGDIKATIVYQRRKGDDNLDRNRILLRSASLFLDRIEIRTLGGQSWTYCGQNVLFTESKHSRSEPLIVNLKKEQCE